MILNNILRKTVPAKIAVLVLFIFGAFFPHSLSAAEEPAPAPLTALSLEELMNVEIYSASKKNEKQFESASATYVLSNEDIRRSGVTTVMDALRLVPGVSVQKVSSHTWDISIRGFNGGIFANKLLVMIDGRSVYTPFHGGVVWAFQDLVLEDIEQIEVVRGPGGALWGANAVNGVINILTKKAKDTQGVLLTGGGGSEESGFGTFRYGGEVDELYYRAYVKHFNRAEGFRGDGVVNDDWRTTKTGFKAEKGPFTLQGDLSGGRAGSIVTRTTPVTLAQTAFSHDVNFSSGNLLAKYDLENFHAQAYWDRTVQEGLVLRERRDRVDFDFNHQFSLPLRQQVIWGGGYRFDIDKYSNTFDLAFMPRSKTHHTASAFVQDEITLIENYWKLIAGSKFEYTTFSGFEYQPNIRTVVTPFEDHVFWAALSRAVRTPSRFELDGLQRLVTSGVLAEVRGNKDLKSEDLISWEAGYRTQIIPNTQIDAAFYYNEYDDLLSLSIPLSGAFSDGTNTILPAELQNGATADVYGFELAADTQPRDWWQIRGGYSFNRIIMHIDPRQDDTSGIEASNEGATPRNIFYVRNSFNLPGDFQFDAILRYSDHLNTWGVSPYLNMDLRLGYQWKNLLLEVVGRDLLAKHHKEHGSAGSTEVERSIFGRATLAI